MEKKQKKTNAQPFQHLLTVIYFNFIQSAKQNSRNKANEKKNKRKNGISFIER